MEARTGQVLFAKKAHWRLPPASLTKMMTALVVIEHTPLDEMVTASKHAVKTPARSMHLREGEEVSVRDLLYALLLRSANDAAVALAEHVDGSVEQFCQRMNQKAKQLGAKSTHFTNPHGLHEPNHYSTAYDMALIARAFMENETLRSIVCQQYYIVRRSINQEDLWMVNKAKFLQMYPYAEGIKTGYTRPAGFCFAGSALKDGRRLITVVLNSPQREQDTTALMEYGFNEWVPIEHSSSEQAVGFAPVENGEETQVPVRLAHNAYRVVPTKQKHAYRWTLSIALLNAPVEMNQFAGWLELRREDRIVLRVPLHTMARVEVRRSPVSLFWAILVPPTLLSVWLWRWQGRRRHPPVRLRRHIRRWD